MHKKTGSQDVNSIHGFNRSKNRPNLPKKSEFQAALDEQLAQYMHEKNKNNVIKGPIDSMNSSTNELSLKVKEPSNLVISLAEIKKRDSLPDIDDHGSWQTPDASTPIAEYVKSPKVSRDQTKK